MAGYLGEVLRERGYTGDAVAEALGLRSVGDLRYADFPIYERQLGGDPLATLTRLFLLNRPVAADEAEAALAPVRLSELADCRLVRAASNGVVALAAITPFAGLFVASDPRPESRRDHVQGVSRATETAAALAVTRSVDAALDVGTGSGVLALLAARHSTRVVGTDVNPRALGYARLSAMLGRVDSIDWRAGSLYGPVAGERFGFICSNARSSSRPTRASCSATAAGPVTSSALSSCARRRTRSSTAASPSSA